MSRRIYPTGYKVPLHNVLLISCMDLRLLDNIIHFMEHENLINRYDQYIMAGASIGALVGSAPDDDELRRIDEYECWKTGLFQHIDLSIQLHNIKDIYILDHRNCGAYKAFLKDGLGDYEEHGYDKEYTDHKKYVERLTGHITAYLKKRTQKSERDPDDPYTKPELAINIHGFLMDIRGNVVLLSTTAPFEDGLA